MKKYTISNIIFLLSMIASGPAVFYIQLKNGADSVSGDWAVDLLANERLHNLTNITNYQYIHILLLALCVGYPLYCGYRHPIRAVWLGLITALASVWILFMYLALNWFGVCYEFCGSFMTLLVPLGLLLTTSIGIGISRDQPHSSVSPVQNT